MLELLFAFFLGIFIGTLTGITPGIHINLVAAILLGISGFFLVHLAIAPLVLVIFLVAMATTHTFVDYVPSIFLGAPNEDDTALSILPGHEMLIKGEAYSAIAYTLYGCLAGLLIILIFSPIFLFLLPKIYPYTERIMPVILLTAIFFLIYFEKTNRISAIIIFLLAGILGLETSILPLKEALLPLFTGLFGVSSLITSINKPKIPKQKIKSLKKITLPIESYLKSIFASIIASPLCSFLPGMGSGQAAVIGSEVTGENDRKGFLVLLGSISTIVTGLSFITLYSIGKARTGIAAAVNDIISLSLKDIWIITLTIIVSGIFSFFITLSIAKSFSKIISRINYSLLSFFTISFLVLIVILFSGWLGLLVMIVSTFLGLTCIYSGVRRTHLMGCLIIPSMIFYLL
jgi:putative membrane protein